MDLIPTAMRENKYIADRWRWALSVDVKIKSARSIVDTKSMKQNVAA